MIDISKLKKGLPISDDPYGDFAKSLGIEKKELIDILKKLVNIGEIIKFRALLNYEKLGYKVSALIAMALEDENKIEKILSLTKITHLYVREKNINFPYDYFAMCHFHDENELKNFAEKLSEMNVKFEIMKTVKNLRK